MDLVTLYNTSEVDQHAYMPDGKRYTLTAQEIREVQNDVAQVFLTQRGKFVQPYQAAYIPPRSGETTVWIANKTGNPFQPERLKRSRLNRLTQMEEEYEIPNPLRVARPIEFEMNREQKLSKNRDGVTESFSVPPERVKIPPTVRLPVPMTVAEWLQRRDSQMTEEHQGSIQVCRGPGDFEPNMSWNLDEMLLYAELLDGSAPWKRFVPAKGEEHDKKLALFKALFFRLTDERYEYVDRAYFQNALLERMTTPPPIAKGKGASEGAAAR